LKVNSASCWFILYGYITIQVNKTLNLFFFYWKNGYFIYFIKTVVKERLLPPHILPITYSCPLNLKVEWYNGDMLQERQ